MQAIAKRFSLRLSKYRHRFRRRLNQSRAVRTGGVSRPDAATLKVGDYVRLRGTVSAGARVLESPMEGVSCVAYRVNVVRVVDSRTAKKKVQYACQCHCQFH